jgi:hypothetical protein
MRLPVHPVESSKGRVRSGHSETPRPPREMMPRCSRNLTALSGQVSNVPAVPGAHGRRDLALRRRAFAFVALVFLIAAGSAGEWWKLLRGPKRIVLHESEFIPLSRVESSRVCRQPLSKDQNLPTCSVVRRSCCNS